MADRFDRLRALLASVPATDGEAALGRARAVPMLASFVVAALLWFTFSMREAYTIAVDAPLRMVRLPEGAALAQPLPASVSVQVRGEGWDLLSLARTPPTLEVAADGAELDLRRAAAASSRFGPDVVVEGVAPSTLRLALDERITRRLPIRLDGRIETPPPYDLLLPPILWPDSVLVTGARSILAGLEAWPTRPVVFEELRRTVVQTVALSDTLRGLVERGEERTQVTLQVEEFTEGARWLDVRVVGVPPGVAAVRFDPPRVRATYLAPTSGDFYDRAAATDGFYAVVDYADIARDSVGAGVPVAVHVPEGLPIQRVRITPRRLDYVTVWE